MLQEAIRELADLAVEAKRAAQPRIIQIPGDDRTIFVDPKGDGQWEERKKPPAKRSHTVTTIEDLATLALYARRTLGLDPAVWHAPDKVVLVFDQTNVWDLATVVLVYAPQWMTLLSLTRPLSQKELLSILRVDLAGCLDSPSLLNSVSHVNFRAAMHGEGSIQHGRESLGKSVESEVAGVREPIPERGTVLAPIYENPGEQTRWPVECDLEIDAANQRFFFRPLPGEMEEALQLQQADIRQRLASALGEEVPVYAGTP